MQRKTVPNRDAVETTPLSVGVGVVALVVLFWISIGMDSPTALVSVVRAGVGATLLIVVVGVLLARLLGVPTYPLGRFGLYAAGLSLATLAVLTTAMSTLLPLLGVVNPLSVVPLTVAVSALVFGLVFAVYLTDTSLVDTSFNYPYAGLSRLLPVVALGSLPVLAVVGAVLMNRYEVNTGMFVFVGAVVVVVVLTATRFVSSRLYPAVVGAVSVSTLLHHNLLSHHVIGADIQATYFTAHLLTQLHHWPPAADGTAMAIPVVTTVPASFSILTGIDLTTVFTVVSVLLFALVPLGVFSVCRGVFDDDIALFAGLFFLFYHVTFTFTPGKQLLSELFAVSLVMVIIRGDLRGYGRSVAVLLLSVGLIWTHYGMTLLFGSALLFAAVVLFSENQLVDETIPRPSVWYPVALLAGASAWYASVSPELFARLVSIPPFILEQVITLLNGGSIEGAGASYVGQQTLLGTLNLTLYGLFIALACVGMGWRLLTTLSAFRRGAVPDDAGYTATALAIPVFVFLGVSFFLVFDLWADRVYQMALVFVAPFMPLGYRYVGGFVSAVGKRVLSPQSMPKRADGGTERETTSGSRDSPKRAVRWTVLAVLLGALLMLNSGMAFALAGPAQNSAFNPNANDLVFSHHEVEGVTWLKAHLDSPSLAVNRSASENRSDATRIYADPQSAQLLRSAVSDDYYTIDIIYLKSKWDTHVHPDQLNDGYVVIREASVTNARQAHDSYSRLSKRDVRTITARGTVVFRNEEIRIVKLGTDTTVGGAGR